jgi:hypothetical protein
MKTKSVNWENESKQQTRQYDLEQQTFDFAKQVRLFIRQIPKTVANVEDIRQLVRASGSVGANTSRPMNL